MQFSVEFDDDATLDQIAAELDRVAASTGYGIALFRAGAAPWHDDLQCYQRLATRMRTQAMRIMTSLHLWDICALIACSRAYCGSSLHGRIVAMAFALPRVNLLYPAQAGQTTKQGAYALTWEEPDMPVVIQVQEIEQGINDALNTDPARLEQTARRLVAHYRRGFGALKARLE